MKTFLSWFFGLLLLVGGTGGHGTLPHPPRLTATPRPMVTAIPLPTAPPMQPRVRLFLPLAAN